MAERAAKARMTARLNIILNLKFSSHIVRAESLKLESALYIASKTYTFERMWNLLCMNQVGQGLLNLSFLNSSTEVGHTNSVKKSHDDVFQLGNVCKVRSSS